MSPSNNGRLRTTDRIIDSSKRARSNLARFINPAPAKPLESLLELFDPEWYVARYAIELGDTFATPFDHYHQAGQSLGYSPGPAFDETAYLERYPDVSAAIRTGIVRSGHEHYVRAGRFEGRATFRIDRVEPTDAPPKATPVEVAPVEESPAVESEPAAETFNFPKGPSLIHRARHKARATAAKAARKLPPRQQAMLLSVEQQLRRVTGKDSFDARHPGLAVPTAFGQLGELDWVLEPFDFHVVPAGDLRVNIFLPRLERELIFGGYIAVLHFLRRLQDRGWHIRILITEDIRATPESIRHDFEGHLAEKVVNQAEIINLVRRRQALEISPADSFIAYSMWTAAHAHRMASAVGRRYLHFVQEYEPTFHAHESLHAIGASFYEQPHFAIFNSEMLRKYFEMERLGVYRDGIDAGASSSAVFAHALSIPRPPSLAEVRHNGPRRVLVYARPETHAARNLFAVAVLGLRKAIAEGVFDDDWEFEGVGSLSTVADIDLGGGRRLKVRPRVGLGSYAQSLYQYDVGLSLQYAPHPGVVHYEMAAAGIVTVTNIYTNRTSGDLTTISENLVGVSASPAGLAAGLATAVDRSADVSARVSGATRPWVTSWDVSFNDGLMERIEHELR